MALFETTVRIERPEGTPVALGVPVMVEQASLHEAIELLGARPYDVFTIYTLRGVPGVPLQRRDVLFDEINTDPETGQPAKYRVTGLVETFFADHQEATVERVVGG